jgi:two-component system chemotaxis sensor kinase CheA
MTLAGELVLGRNQLIQAKNSRDSHSMDAVCQRIDLITSELQETIMLTRMQPIGNIFNKFPRVVRDLARDLGKEIDLKLEGREVELDKTIIEGLNDPLTHLVRNAVDHGIETPEGRKKAGKPAVGTVQLIAYHEAGQVNIEIVDDGGGINPEKLGQVALKKGLITEEQLRLMTDEEKIALILLPGFSTAEKVTDVSGRGVGMDVVKTNLDKLGGLIQIDSKVGVGTTLRIKLPLTLAIIPTQIVSAGGERFAIPQVNMDELLRIPAAQIKERIEIVGDAEVVRLRGKLLPLIVLSEVLNITRSYKDPETGVRIPDRRNRLSDRRSRISDAILAGEAPAAEENRPEAASPEQSRTDRRYHTASAVNIVVVSTGSFKYGLVVDELNDAEEIVVKPLGRHLKRCKGYAGATIMGDGQVSLIIDVSGIASLSQLNSLDRTERASEVAREEGLKKIEGLQSLLLFHNAPDEQFAVSVELVLRIEKINASQIEVLGGQRTIQYRGGSLPLFTIAQVANLKPLPEVPDYVVLVFSIAKREIGLIACGPVDAVDCRINVDTDTLKQPGISGSSIIDGVTTLMIDIYSIIETLHSDWFVKHETVATHTGGAVRILFAEDSDFFRTQIASFLADDGFDVYGVTDGREAWEYLEANPKKVDLLVTDIEMPNLDGFQLVKRMRADARYAGIPVVAVTTRASDEDLRTGESLGIEEYQIKLDKERLMEAIHRAAQKAISR